LKDKIRAFRSRTQEPAEEVFQDTSLIQDPVAVVLSYMEDVGETETTFEISVPATPSEAIAYEGEDNIIWMSSNHHVIMMSFFMGDQPVKPLTN